MSCTIFGTLTKRGGLAMNRFYGDFRGLDLDDLDVLPTVTVDVDHDGRRVGQVHYIERSEQGHIRLVAVATLDDLVDISQRRDVFLSGEYVTTTHSPHGRAWIGTDPTLKSVGLTFTPCTIGAIPATVVAGDITKVADRMHWPIGRLHQYPILRRCVDQYRPGQPLRLRDLTPTFNPRAARPPRPAAKTVDTSRVPGLHYSGGEATGHVIAVR